MDIGEVGIWGSWGWYDQDAADAAEVATELEDLGYGALWLSGGFGRGVAPYFRNILAGTSRLVVASGIISIWADEAAEHRRRRRRAGPGRAGPVPARARGQSRGDRGRLRGSVPSAVLQDGRATSTTSTPLHPRCPVTVGCSPHSAPRCCSCRPSGPGARIRTSYRLNTPPSPARRWAPARCWHRNRPSCSRPTRDKARAIAREHTAGYLTLPNYTNNLRRFGFTDEDLSGGGSDRLVDAIVAWGDAAAIAQRVRAHRAAGADHVCLQVLSEEKAFPRKEYREISAALNG